MSESSSPPGEQVRERRVDRDLRTPPAIGPQTGRVAEHDGIVARAQPGRILLNRHPRLREPQTEIRSSRGRIWTHPVISNGRLYLRDQDLIYCYDIKAR